MATQEIPTTPYDDQKPGTSGLRQKVARFAEPDYLENFVQAIFDTVDGLADGGTLVLGGDGRYYSDTAIATILRLAAANGVGHVLLGRDGLFSTPACSATIRRRGATGGILLTASHNPGGPDGDFGVKYNIDNGGPAPESVTNAIFERSKVLDRYYLTEEEPDIDWSREGSHRFAGMEVTVVDPVADYKELMAELFDFDAIRALLRGGFAMVFDAMHGVTGPYARALLEDELGAPAGTVINAVPLPDFAGGHPDPNPVYAADLLERLRDPSGPDFGAASDGDGDRNMILGTGFWVNPSDSLAIIADQLGTLPGYRGRVTGVARSMPTSRAADRVAQVRGINAYETPTGWKFFGNLLDAGEVVVCGEESFGTSSDHVREKDGIWAVLCWLNILAYTGKSVQQVVADHWAAYGRDFYTRHDFEGLSKATGDAILTALRDKAPSLGGTKTAAGPVVEMADEFAYTDPIDGSVSERQGIRIWFTDGARAVFRLSGTGTSGATLRVYVEKWEGDASQHQADTQAVLSEVAAAARELAELERLAGVSAPSLVV
jgi:phosphoglucomutase